MTAVRTNTATIFNDARLTTDGEFLLSSASILEITTGLALIAVPSYFVHMLIGLEVFGAGVFVGRLCGIGLLSLGLACWPVRADRGLGGTIRGLRAMLTYNFLAAAYLGYLRLGRDLTGVLLWPAVIVHTLFAIGFALAVWKPRAVSL
jgi:hypothetical protein